MTFMDQEIIGKYIVFSENSKTKQRENFEEWWAKCFITKWQTPLPKNSREMLGDNSNDVFDVWYLQHQIKRAYSNMIKYGTRVCRMNNVIKIPKPPEADTWH